MFAIIVTCVVTSLLVLVALNFAPPEKKIERRITHAPASGDPQFLREMSVLLGPGIIAGNKVEALQNGEEIFPAMLEAVRAAQRSITFETYIYWSGDIGREMAQALAERARGGVAVHVLLDWVGSVKMEQTLLDTMVDAGVQVERYHPLHWYHIARMNNRTHRKLLVVDGRIGFTGGVGIADQWQGNAQDPDHWRDMHFRIEGPVVAQIQSTFMDNWIKTTGEVLQGEAYFPRLEPADGMPAQMFSSSPTGGSESMQLMYLMAIAAARTSIDIKAAYFVPDELALDALLAAAGRGVRVRVIVPGEHIDADTVRWASQAQWGRLLQAGIAIHEYTPTMYHCKALVVDGYLVSVGSTNFDARSFRLNDEASLNVYDTRFAAQMTASFENDLAHTRRITFEQWQARPWSQRLRERVASLFKSQL
ncbi:cardiolipin synthase [Chiayiivirga flava]|nr:cardiolipin synthase [Chiayiivirga flava]